MNMKAYRVLINAQNIMMETDGKIGHYGLYTTRVVLAPDHKTAIHNAIDLIKNEEDFKMLLLNSADDPPLLSVEDIEEVDQPLYLNKKLSGYTLYPENKTTH